MIKVIAIDKNKQRHVAETLSAAEYAAEGPEGCATIARQFCLDNGIGYSNFAVEPVAANAGQLLNIKVA